MKFTEGLDKFEAQFGTGPLRGEVEVNQIYAHYQEANDWLKHPRGGEAHALQNSLYRRNRQHMQDIARRTITKDGSDVIGGMSDAMEDLSEQYYLHAPEEWGDLRASGHPTVTSDGATVYDRSPNTRRLTEDELRAKGDLSRLFGSDLL